MRKRVFCAAALALCAGAARAEVKPNALFSDGAVLQRDMAAPVWGTAERGERVVVRFQNQTAETVAGEDGSWSVLLPPLKAGGPYTLAVNSTEIKNVLVGDVWVCSGQSNMQWSLRDSANAQEAVAQANYPNIRLFTVPRQATAAPLRDVNAKWEVCSPVTVPGFSAVAYYFGRELHQRLRVPIGLVSTNYGGTPAEAWTSRAALDANPLLRGMPAAQAGNANSPSGLYNAMIAPLLPYAIRGAIWYQGESNAGQAYLYRTLFPAMIRNWRRDWGQGDFPFLFVQLAPFMKIEAQPTESAWAELREAQLLTTLTTPRTGMAVITDAGAENDIHPKDKKTVGERLAQAARVIAYGERGDPCGPVYDGLDILGDHAVLHFRNIGEGLMAKGGELTGFAIAGADRKFVNAQARIEGKTVVVWSPQVPHPVAVRYGWANFPVVNLYNRAGLPASPFRTDDFPMITQPK